MKKLLVFLVLVYCGASQAAVKYLRQGASGSGSGNDWDNAYTSFATLESNLARGDTGWVADGSYSAVIFDALEAGSTLITVKKATVADHGTSTGWSDAFGDGQAFISGNLRFHSDYVTLDGNTDVVGSYGFVAQTTAGPGIAIHDGVVGSNNISVRDLWLDLTGSSPGVRGVEATRGPDNLLLHNVRITLATDDCINVNSGANNTTIEYCWIDRAGAYGAIHADAIVFACANGANVLRHNIIDWGGQQIWIDGTCTSYDGTWDIYGNTFYYTTQALAKWISHHSNVVSIGAVRVRNNTIVGCSSGLRMDAAIGSSLWANNIYYSSTVPRPASEVTGAFGGTNGAVGTSPQTITSSIFVNFANEDFRLASATNAGTTYSSPFNVDRFGTTRGADGVWDRGAYEFGSAGSAGAIQLSVSSYQIDESSTPLTVTATRTGGSTGAVGISYATSNGTAVSGSDYTSASGTLSWANADSADKTFTVPITNDVDVEGNQTFNITLSVPTGGAALGSPSTAVATIVDNESPTVPLLTSPWEAEDMLIESPFVAASGKVSQPSTTLTPADGGRARARFTIPSTGDYTMTINVNVPSVTEDTIFVEIDGEPATPDDIADLYPPTVGVETKVVTHRGTGSYNSPQFNPMTWTLSAGEHTVYFRGREPCELDSVAIVAVSGADTTPPTPDPATWETVPFSEGSSSISMTASTASDPTVPIQYSFEETSGNPGATSSGWQSSPDYADSGLLPGTTYTYRVRVRDAVGTPNVTGYSSSLSATTEQLQATGAKKRNHGRGSSGSGRLR